MRKILTVASRDFVAAVQSKYFRVVVLLVPLLMVGGGLLGKVAGTQKELRDKRIAVVDRTPGEKFYPVIEEAVRQRNETQLLDPETNKQVLPAFHVERIAPAADDPESIRRQRLELSDRARRDDIAGFLEIGPDVGLPGAEPGSERASLRYHSDSIKPELRVDSFPRFAERAINQTVQQQRSVDAGVSLQQLQRVLQPVPLVARTLSQRDPATGAITEAPKEGALARFATMLAVVMLMYLGIFLSASFLIQAVLEEKMQRIAEVLLGSIRPFELMMGKLLGLGGASFLVIALYAGSLYGASRWFDLGGYLPPLDLLPWFAVFFVLGILMYGSVSMALGAAGTDLKEVNVLFTPVMMLAIAPLLLVPVIQDQPNGPLALAFSFFPPTTPTIMVARMALPAGVPWWQPPLGALVMAAATIGCVWAAGRVFRVGILMQGKGARFRELFRWALRG